jgi:NADPH2:quinone reductase
LIGQHTWSDVFGKIDAENLKKVHVLLERGVVKGKIVLEGF